MQKKLIVMMLLLPLLLMMTIFTSTNTVAMNVPVSVSKIEIVGDRMVYLDLDSNEEYEVSYNIYPVAASNKNVTMKVEQVGDSPVCELEFVDGKIIPKSVGEARVYLTTVDGGFKDSFIVKVDSILLQSIECSVDSSKMFVGDRVSIQTTFVPSNAENKELVYSSSNTQVVSVSNKGVITAEGNGFATITIASESNPAITDTIEIEVMNKDIMDLGGEDVYTWSENGQFGISVDTEEDYNITYEIFDKYNNPIQEGVIVDTGTDLVFEGNGYWIFKYEFESSFLDSIIVKFTIVTDNPQRQPLTKERVIHKVNEMNANYDSNDAISGVVGSLIPALNSLVTVTPGDISVLYSVTLSNTNLSVEEEGRKVQIRAVKPGVTKVRLTVTNADLPEQSVTLLEKDVVILPKDLDFEVRPVVFGIENLWTVGGKEANGNSCESCLSVVTGDEERGAGFGDALSFETDNPNVEVDSTGKITISQGFNGLVNVTAKFGAAYGEACTKASQKYTIRCVGDGVNVRSFMDLYEVTERGEIAVIQSEIKENFGKKRSGEVFYTEDSVTKIQSTYDTTYYSNIGRLDEAKIKVLISFKEDVYGNGYEINAGNVAYGLDESGALKSDALFRGPLNFVSMSESESSAISVKAQDNISFAVYKNVTLQNVNLKSCDLESSKDGYSNLTHLKYVGTTVEVLGDNVNIIQSRISNGRTVLRIFGDGDIEKKANAIHVNIDKCILSQAREFILRIGTNCFVNGSTEAPSPLIDPNQSFTFPIQEHYESMSPDEKLEYDSKYIKTFVNLKNSVLEKSGIFCVGIDTHFSGVALADGSNMLDGLIKDWHDLAKTSYGAKLTLDGDVRMYDWKDVESIDSSRLLIEIKGNTKYDIDFDIKELIKKLGDSDKSNLNTIVYSKTNNDQTVTKYVHGGIAFWGGGKNYGIVERSNHDFMELNGYSVKLSDIGKEVLQAASGNESFYFLLNDSTTIGFLPEDQESIFASGEAYAPTES